MRQALQMAAALRSVLFTRLDLLFEILALRHQLAVLGRAKTNSSSDSFAEP
jgi:hypothetical protein